MLDENLSDHRYIFFEIKDDNKSKARDRKIKLAIDWEVFRMCVECRITGDLDVTYMEGTRIIREAYKNSVIYSESGETTRMPYWWNGEISDKRNECNKLRRKLTRISKCISATDLDKTEAREKYKRGKKELIKLINTSKRELWRKLCEELDNDIWGQGYMIAVKGLKNLV